MLAQATQVLELRDAMGHELYRELLREEVVPPPLRAAERHSVG